VRESPTLARQAELLSEELIDRAAETALRRRIDAVERPATSARTLVLALLVMGPVLLTGPAVIAAGVLLLLGGGFGQILGGVLLLLLGFLSHPRREQRADPVVTLEADRAPRTFALVSTIAEARGAPHVRALTITSTVSARVDVLGWRRRRTISLGAPLWVGLEPSARVALLSHEVAHLARRELVVVRLGRRALATLDEWWQLFGGQRSIEDVKPDSERNAMSWGMRLMWAPLRLPTAWYHRVLVRRLAPLCTTGELLADLDAVALAGREGATAMLDAYLSGGTSEVALSRARQTHVDLEAALQ
jgi:heat shock protein HtpX